MTDQNQTRPVRCPLWMRIVLGVSLAMNLAVIGLAVGIALRFGGPDGGPPPRTIATALIRELPKEHRAALREMAFSRHDDMHDRRRADAEAVGAALKSVPFDPEALRAVLTEQGARRAAFEASVLDTWLLQVTKMSDAERAAYADRLQHTMGRDRHDRRKDD